MQETVLITGGSGLVGSRLTQLLLEKGYAVRHISRKRDLGAGVPRFQWNLDTMEWDIDAIDGVSFIVHLAGSGVANGRWTAKRRKEIFESRVRGSQLVCKMARTVQDSLKAVISSSAVGYYGTSTKEEIIFEDANPGEDFLATVCVEWERAVLSCKSMTHIAVLRTGIVLSKNGGALPKMAFPIKLGIGSPLGHGRQSMPWIHMDDLCDMYIYALEEKLEGVFNAVAPDPVSNKAFTKCLANTLKRKILLPHVPGFVLKLMFGEMAQVLLTGVNASSEKMADAGFKWQFPELESALENIYN